MKVTLQSGELLLSPLRYFLRANSTDTQLPTPSFRMLSTADKKEATYATHV